MKAVFKTETAQSDDHNEDDANLDVSMIDQTDVIETCLLLRDSVISLKAVIRDLQQEVTDLKSHVTRLDGRLTSKDVSTNVDAAEPDTVPAVNALIPTAPLLETIEEPLQKTILHMSLIMIIPNFQSRIRRNY